MKTIVVYKSSTGFTKKYAELISQRLGCKAAPLKSVSDAELPEVDRVIFDTRIHAGRIDGLAKAKGLFKKSGGESFIVFATGATPAEAKDVIEKLWRENFSADEIKGIPHFYMPAGLCYEKMSFPDRMLMKMAAKMMSKAENKSPVEQGFANAITASYDISHDGYIEPLLDYLKNSDAAPN